MVHAKDLCMALDLLAEPERKLKNESFFKTGVGQYGYGDVFIGVSVPEQRAIARDVFPEVNLEELSQLLCSEIHEYRSCALFILVYKYAKAKCQKEHATYVEFYRAHLDRVNNWDLVDASCYKILGHYAYEYDDHSLLRTLSKSKNLWENRMAIVSTLYHVKKDSFELTKAFSLLNLQHPHDLMHKANGWLLREMGKRDENELIEFLECNAPRMPRTTLRYAIEKLSVDQRHEFLNWGK